MNFFMPSLSCFSCFESSGLKSLDFLAGSDSVLDVSNVKDDEVIERQDERRENAMRGVLRVLRSRISLMCVPDREAATDAIKTHGLTLEELFEFAVNENKRNS